MISIAACGLSFFIGFVIGISFFALCKNELELEIAKHRMTMDALIKLQKQVNHLDENFDAWTVAGHKAMLEAAPDGDR